MERNQNFTKPEVWRRAYKLVLNIYKTTNDFPVKENYNLVSQMNRAAVSVASNIAEGYTKFSHKEKIRFYKIAQGSLVELQNQLIISLGLKYIKQDNFKVIILETTTVNKLLNGLIRGCRKYFSQLPSS